MLHFIEWVFYQWFFWWILVPLMFGVVVAIGCLVWWAFEKITGIKYL